MIGSSSEMRIWSSGEEAYIAPNVEAVLEFHRTEYGLPDGDFPSVDEWTEQTGELKRERLGRLAVRPLEKQCASGGCRRSS